MVKQAVPLQPMEVDGGADIHLQPIEDPRSEQEETPEGGCDPMGSPCWSRLLAGLVALWREDPTLEQVNIQLCNFSVARNDVWYRRPLEIGKIYKDISPKIFLANHGCECGTP
ncbi:AN1-type zinc finger protein 5-like [Grus japonensis]|uniref:AN1-type zinc finger protein 5-like n=1 Tax=Grus japonensis TaxID=30415 RepID=A0ABC9WM68_GRUJA